MGVQGPFHMTREPRRLELTRRSGTTPGCLTYVFDRQLATVLTNREVRLHLCSFGRSEARAEIHDEVDRVLDRWRNSLGA